ncbi:hypothetical protein OSL75_18110, partial [Escherichia coli]|nr:hypothetical protein [Escherichia coli]
MISLKAPRNNLMPYTQQSILNTVKNNQLPEDIKSSWICPYISRHLLSLNPLQARCRRYSR